MSEILRESPFGQLMRLINPEWFPYPEESVDFKYLALYDGSHQSDLSDQSLERQVNEKTAGFSTTERDLRQTEGEGITNTGETNEVDLERQQSLILQRTRTLPHTTEQLAVETTIEAERTTSKVIEPSKTKDGIMLVDWYETNDPANPQNWSQKKKAFVAFQIDLYTFVVYATGAIYISSEPGLLKVFDVSEVEVSLGLALYVLGYGIGPLLWSPMSEIPRFGRSLPYIGTFAIFIILSIPTALAKNFGGFLFLRFLLGFFGSPCLATGGASMSDMYSLLFLPFSIGLWVAAVFAAPAVGPILSGFAAPVKGWRFPMWEGLWLSAPVFILWFFFLPETYAPTILSHRAARLRKVLKQVNIQSQSEIDSKGRNFHTIAYNAIIKPFEITLKDPAVLFAHVYSGIVYAVYYSFFDAFPLVYGPIYGFNFGEMTLVFLCEVIGCTIGISIYFSYVLFRLIPDIMKNGLRAQEWRLRPGLFSVFGISTGLFIFGWTAREDIHWIVSLIGITTFVFSVYIVLQCIFIYLPMSYPQYSASLFAANDLFRSSFAFASILYGRPLYINLGIGKGTSVLGGISALGIIGIWVLYFYGAKLRARSSFAQK